jgi:Flp pilus assembly protein TadG
MAITLIVYLLMLFAVVDFSRALYAYHFVSHVARDAARLAAVNGADCADDGSCNGAFPMHSGPLASDDGSIQTYVRTFTPPGINSTSVTASVIWPGTPATTCSAPLNSPGCTVEVTVQYPFNFLAPIVSTTTVEMTSTSAMVIAH